MKLSNKLILSFLLAIFLSIFLISLIANSMINKRFDTYLVEEQQERLKRISRDLNQLYNENGHVFYEREINSYARLENIYIEVRDLDDKVLYASSNAGHMMHMGGMHGRMMRRHGMSGGQYVEKNFPNGRG